MGRPETLVGDRRGSLIVENCLRKKSRRAGQITDVSLYGSSKPIECSKERSYRVIDEIQVDRPVRQPRLEVLNRERKMPEPQLRIGVVGLGLLGAGLRRASLRTDSESSASLVPRRGLNLHANISNPALRELVAHGVALPMVATEWQNYYSEAESLAEFSDCDFVIESIFEDFEVKSRTLQGA